MKFALVVRIVYICKKMYFFLFKMHRRSTSPKKTGAKKCTIFKPFICTPKQNKNRIFLLLSFQEHVQVISQKILSQSFETKCLKMLNQIYRSIADARSISTAPTV